VRASPSPANTCLEVYVYTIANAGFLLQSDAPRLVTQDDMVDPEPTLADCCGAARAREAPRGTRLPRAATRRLFYCFPMAVDHV
jgi:hypothetical protein